MLPGKSSRVDLRLENSFKIASTSHGDCDSNHLALKASQRTNFQIYDQAARMAVGGDFAQACTLAFVPKQEDDTGHHA